MAFAYCTQSKHQEVIASEAKQSRACAVQTELDCFVALLLAMAAPHLPTRVGLNQDNQADQSHLNYSTKRHPLRLPSQGFSVAGITRSVFDVN
ncbi:MAG TPA: hypothetical protein VHB49_13075 [Bradyrhizobium sp.]|nr:hypothetical protein [Bradyrhizobium sp.]